MDYRPNKEVIARRIARIFQDGDVVNLGIGLPTLVGNYIPRDIDVILHSENGFVGLGPEPEAGDENAFLVNAGGLPVTIRPGGSFFDSSMSFGIIRGGHLDYTVLGVLEVDQEGSLANYMIPGKMVPGMGGAMDLLTGARHVIAASVHFNKDGTSKMTHRCTLPLTAKGEVDTVVTDVGLFGIAGEGFLLKEYFPPATPEWILEQTSADIVVPSDCREYGFDENG